MRKYVGKEPKIGDKNAVIAFAWFPKRTDDGYLIWLEYYLSLRKYTWVGGLSFMDVPSLEWSEYHSEVM